ncbi:MAG: 50S ribosomal protein L29 [bacterium]|nr:50S ribosomal protein L29 [bacterium]
MKEFKGKSLGELEKTLTEKREALRVFRFEVSGGKIKNVKIGRNIRTEIAQILTEINTQKAK